MTPFDNHKTATLFSTCAASGGLGPLVRERLINCLFVKFRAGGTKINKWAIGAQLNQAEVNLQTKKWDYDFYILSFFVRIFFPPDFKGKSDVEIS